MDRRSLFAGIVLAPLLATIPKAIGAKLAKTEVKYQDQPNAGKDCDDCLQFVPDAKRKGAGTCKVVAGAVSAHGYCLAFTPRPKNG